MVNIQAMRFKYLLEKLNSITGNNSQIIIIILKIINRNKLNKKMMDLKLLLKILIPKNLIKNLLIGL